MVNLDMILLIISVLRAIMVGLFRALRHLLNLNRYADTIYIIAS